MSVESNISENEEVTVPKQRESDATYGEFSDIKISDSEGTYSGDVNRDESEDIHGDQIPKEKIMENLEVFEFFSHDVPKMTHKKSVDVYTQKTPKRKTSIEIYGEDGPVTKRPERNRPETIREVCPGADIRKTDDTDDEKGKERQDVRREVCPGADIRKTDDTDDEKGKERQDVRRSDNELRKENRKRTYAVPKPRQPSAEVQNSNLTSVEYLPPEKNADSSSSLKTPVKSESVTPRNRSDIPVMKVRQPSAEKQEKIPPQPEKAESSGSVRTSVPSAPITPRSEEHVPAKRKRTPRTISSQKTPSPKKKEEPMSCHSRTHLRLDPDWVSPRMEKQQLELQQQRGGRSKDNEKKKRKKKKGSHSRKRKEERRKRRAKTASDIIKLKVNGNRVTPLTKSPTSTSQTSGKISKSSEQVLTRRHRASSTSRSTLKSKSTDVQQTIMLDSATQTSLIRLSVPQSTTTEEVRREEETPKKKKGWFARCCGRK